MCTEICRKKLSLCCRVHFSKKIDRVKVARQRQWSTAPNDQRIPARILRHLYISDNLLLKVTKSLQKQSPFFYHDLDNYSYWHCCDICGIFDDDHPHEHRDNDNYHDNHDYDWVAHDDDQTR